MNTPLPETAAPIVAEEKAKPVLDTTATGSVESSATTPAPADDSWRGHLAMVIHTLIIGIGYSYARNASVAFAPEVLVSLRMLGGFLVLTPLFFLKGGFRTFKPTPDLWRFMALMMLLGMAGNQYFFAAGLKLTTAANGALMYAITPMFVLLISVFIARAEAMSAGKLLGVVVALTGVGFIFSQKSLDFGSDVQLGNLISLVAVVFWSVYMVYNRRLAAHLDPVQMSAAMMAMGALLFLPIMIWRLPTVDYAAVPASGWTGLLYMIMIHSVISFLLIVYALAKLKSSQVSIYMNMQPVVATLWAVLVMGEDLTMAFVIGGSLTVLGVFLLNLAQRRMAARQMAD